MERNNRKINPYALSKEEGAELMRRADELKGAVIKLVEDDDLEPELERVGNSVIIEVLLVEGITDALGPVGGPLLTSNTKLMAFAKAVYTNGFLLGKLANGFALADDRDMMTEENSAEGIIPGRKKCEACPIHGNCPIEKESGEHPAEVSPELQTQIEKLLEEDAAKNGETDAGPS